MNTNWMCQRWSGYNSYVPAAETTNATVFDRGVLAFRDSVGILQIPNPATGHQQRKKTGRSSFFVIPLGFEPKTHSLEGCCSIQLSYGTILNGTAKLVIFY